MHWGQRLVFGSALSLAIVNIIKVSGFHVMHLFFAQQVPLLGFDELESQSLKLCADIDAFGQGGLDILCPLSPEVHDELFTPFSGALSGDSTDESLLSSPSLGASLAHDASSCLDALHSHQSQPMPLTASQRQESVVSAYHPAPAQQQYQLMNTSSCSEGDQSTCPSSSQLTDDAGSTRSQKRAKVGWWGGFASGPL
ncbi:hypothetical protein N2152v2_003599 [Parachlorella kessleri]